MNYKNVIMEIIRGKSLARALVNISFADAIQERPWLLGDMKILEIGAEAASHQKFCPKTWKIQASNYKQITDKDLVINAEDKFPVPDNAYNGVICLNTLYVINDYANCFSESLRVADRFALFHVPLIQAIVPHPHDFTRLTEDRLVSLSSVLSKDHRIDDFEIIPVGGSFSSAVSLIDPFLKYRILRLPVSLVALLLDNLDKVVKRKCPLLYMVLIKKA